MNIQGLRSLLAVTVCAVFIVGAVAFSATSANQQNTSPKYLPGTLFVKFKANSAGSSSIQSTSIYNRIMQRYAVQKVEQPFLTGKAKNVPEEFARIYQFTLPDYYNVATALQELRSDPSIEYAEPNYIYAMSDFIPNDPSFASQGHLTTIQAQKAWDITKGDTTVVIGIVDSGTDYNHVDLAANIWTNPGETGTDGLGHDKRTNGIDDDGNGFVDDWRGWDFVGASTAGPQDNDPHPKNGSTHGTHTAGIASAATNNGIGIASIGFKSKLMITKHGIDTPGDNGIYSGSLGILYCINNGANIVSCSWGGSGSSSFDQDVVKYGLQKNVLVIAASGNGGADQIGDDNELFPNFPSNYVGVLSVGATNNSDKITSYSNYAIPPIVGVFAPGDNILSTIVGSVYGNLSGTSMSTPLVSGLASLVKAKNPSWTPAQIIFQLCGTADNIDALNPTRAGKLGYGRINAYRALTETPAPLAPRLSLASITVDDATGGNNNKKLDPGENVKIVVGLQNAWADANNVVGTLATTHWTTNVTHATSNFGFIRGISKIDSSTRTNQADAFTVSINADAIPSVVPFTLSLTAAGGYTKSINFTLTISGSVLVVDDDDGSNNVESYTTSALDALGVAYDIWDHANNGSPSGALLSSYSTVIWSTEWTVPTLDSLDRKAITQYLNGGGNLFLSGQENGWDLNGSDGPEFIASGGASKTFYETYLKSKFLADDAGSSDIKGVANDSIGDGLLFVRNQPGRSTGQNPDVIDTVGGSKPIFIYNSGSFLGKASGVRYTGAYKLVSLSFGGFESIVDSATRVQVMSRVLKFLNPYTLTVDKVFDTENTSAPYPVNATAVTSKSINSVDLYWDNDGTFPYKKIPMSNGGSGKYSASIPAQVANTNVNYFVLVKTSDGFLPYLNNVFHVGPDGIPPVIVAGDTIQNSIKLKGPFSIIATITDNTAVDTNNVFIKYAVNGGTESQAKMTRTPATNSYTGTISFGANLVPGNIVSYYLNASDGSAAKNQTRYPTSGTRSFVIGRELLDDFEHGKNAQWSYGAWGISTKYHIANEVSSITDSPSGNYLSNDNNILQRLTSYDLTQHTKAALQFYGKVFVDPSDTFYIEASKDGALWAVLSKSTGIGSVLGGLSKQVVLLDNFTGAGTQNVQFRFRLKSDASLEADGVYIDYVEVVTGDLVTGVASDHIGLPVEYSLSQNYPNPFNPGTTIEFTVPNASDVSLVVYDVLGRQILSLAHGTYQPGTYRINMDASQLATGIYYYRLTSGSFTSIKKMLLLK